MATVPRVAFFTDTFSEINGVALTSRELTSFARRRDYPFLCVRGAQRNSESRDGSVNHFEVARGPLSFGLDRGLLHDPALWRHLGRIRGAVREFRPDIIHVVSPGDVSEVGVCIARRMKLPLAISWHTNLHEFGAMRFAKLLSWLGDSARRGITEFSESRILDLVIAFYKLGDVLFAPNEELIAMLGERTAKPVLLMKRGIDTELFNRSRRTVSDGLLRIGYVGRITPEKNVRFLKDLEAGLQSAGVPPYRFMIVGDGSERDWLAQNLRHADFPGILRGEELAEAYANMDVFAFPSRTDTFGNVVLEAFASGTPAVVTEAGGPKFIVRAGASGFIAHNDDEFIRSTAQLLRDPVLRSRMSLAARHQASAESWDAVFDQVYEGYRLGIAARQAAPYRSATVV